MDIEEVETIAVLGAGTMGHGITEIAALAGYDVNMRDIEEGLVQEGYDEIEWSLDKLAERGTISEADASDAIERITPLVDLQEAVEGADVVIEAVPEQFSIKEQVYQEVKEYAPDEAIFATNTSSLSITDLSEITDRPERFCGMHFFNPPVRMDLVEVITGAHTDERTLELVEALATDMDKTPVRVRKDAPGFIVNRILIPMMNEAAWLVEEDAATIEEIDSAAKFDLGLPMGVFELTDQIGVDVGLHVLEYMYEQLGDAYEPCPLIVQKVEEEKLGKKTGIGFYDYEDGGAEIPADAGSSFARDRLLATIANQVAFLIGEDVADPDAIDKATILGAGFPDGPAAMADDAGLDHLLSVLETAHEETGHPRYEPAEYFEEAASAGGFHAGSGSDASAGTAEASFDTLRIDHPGEMVGKLVLDRPHQMNSIDQDVLDELEVAIAQLEADDDVRAILLLGEGDAFSVGADVKNFVGDVTPQSAVELSRSGHRAFGALETCDLPVVAGIDGFCLGGGMEIAACADLRVASERSQIGLPEHSLGLLPGWGGTQRLQHIVGAGRAKEIIFTAERYDPETMADYGFVNEVVSNDELEERAFELTADLAAGPPIAQKYTKRAMHRGREDVDAGLELEAQAFGLVTDTDDIVEGVTAFLNDEEPKFEGK